MKYSIYLILQTKLEFASWINMERLTHLVPLKWHNGPRSVKGHIVSSMDRDFRFDRDAHVADRDGQRAWGRRNLLPNENYAHRNFCNPCGCNV